MDGTQQKIVKMRNELKAQKVYSGLTYSSLLLPENTPSLSYSGTASLSGSGSTPVARVRFRFTRSDRINSTPLVNFAYDASCSPTYKQFAEANGFSFSANDLSYLDSTDITGYIGEIGDGYVDYYVDYDAYMRTKFFSLNSIGISISCQAISSVSGTLSVERLI